MIALIIGCEWKNCYKCFSPSNRIIICNGTKNDQTNQVGTEYNKFSIEQLQKVKRLIRITKILGQTIEIWRQLLFFCPSSITQ